MTEGGFIMDFSKIPAGTLRVGTMTSLGKIERVSLTAYCIGGMWFSFDKIHGAAKPAQPLAAPWLR